MVPILIDTVFISPTVDWNIFSIGPRLIDTVFIGPTGDWNILSMVPRLIDTIFISPTNDWNIFLMVPRLIDTVFIDARVDWQHFQCSHGQWQESQSITRANEKLVIGLLEWMTGLSLNSWYQMTKFVIVAGTYSKWLSGSYQGIVNNHGNK